MPQSTASTPDSNAGGTVKHIDVTTEFADHFKGLEVEQHKRREWDKERVVDAQARAEVVSGKVNVAIDARADADAAIEKLCSTLLDARQKKLVEVIRDDFTALRTELREAADRLTSAEQRLEETSVHLHKEVVSLREGFTKVMDGVHTRIIVESQTREEEDAKVAARFPPHFHGLRVDIRDEKEVREVEVDGARPRLHGLESSEVKSGEIARVQILSELAELQAAVKQETVDRIQKQNEFRNVVEGYAGGLRKGLAFVNRSSFSPKAQ